MILSGGRYLARDSGITLNMSKTFKTGFTIGFFATKQTFLHLNLERVVLIKEYIFQFHWI